MQPHIRCEEKDAAKYAILPGDPKRVDHAARFLDEVKEICFNREYKSITGFYHGVKVLIMSTGMGGTSVGIGVEELKNIGVKTMIRIGSCGALQDNIQIGDLIIANGAVRDEGTSKAYIDAVYPAVPDSGLLMKIIDAAKESGYRFHTGIIRSHDSFYTDKEDEIDCYWSKKGVLGADMETAALLTIGRLRGIQCASILNTVCEYQSELKEELNNYVNQDAMAMEGEEHEILTALRACELMETGKGRDLMKKEETA